MNGFSNGHRRTQSQTEDRRPSRINKCDACKKKNVLALRETQGEGFNLKCSNCGEYPGIISSYRTCPHDPVHRSDEAHTCEKQKCQAQATRKRRKEVFTTDELPHIWMHSWRSQGNARNSAGNLYFQQASIYSYGNHFEIARHVETKRGDAILFMPRLTQLPRHDTNPRSGKPYPIVCGCSSFGLEPKQVFLEGHAQKKRCRL